MICSCETLTTQAEHPELAQSCGVAQNLVHATRPLIGQTTFKPASQSEVSTPLPDRLIQQARFKVARMELERYLMTDTPFSSTVSRTGSSADSSSEDNSLPSPSERASCASSLGGSSTLSKATAHDETGEPVAEQDPLRPLHFANTLARLEGRTAPNPPSPIQRYVHPKQYNDNVVLEHFSPILRCPRPKSWANRVKMRRLFQVGTFDEFDEPKLPGHPMMDESLERPKNPTPYCAIFHREE